jgi:aspartate/methionine/tyrosine aminotransferase
MRVQQRVTTRRTAGLPVYPLHVGQPSSSAPSTVRAAAHAALDGDLIAYTDALGIAPLRDAIAGHYKTRYGLAVDPRSVGITTGSSAAFQYAFLAAFEVGDTVAVTRPGYPAYRNTLLALGCEVVYLDCGADVGYPPSGAMLEALPEPPAGLVLAGPANPTGTVTNAATLAGIAAWCAAKGTRLISDEIYHALEYGEPAASAWQTDRSSVVVNSFSKYFSMTGWRIGWMLLPDDLYDPVDRLAGNLALCPPTLSQLAAVAAFDATAELEANLARYAANRGYLLDALPGIGIDRFAPPDGAFYIYADVSRWTDDSLSWCATLLDETGVALAPGIDFDPVDGDRFVRLCFAGDGAELATAIDLLGAWLS